MDLPRTFSTAYALEDSARVCAIANQPGNPVLLSKEEISRQSDFLLSFKSLVRSR